MSIENAPTSSDRKSYEMQTDKTRTARMQWWNEARFGMFVHHGLYSLIGRNEWVQAIECIPKSEYEKLADRFQPKIGKAREWAALARDSGMKYMVFTTKHHEGYCLWNTKQTDFNSVKKACGRDLVAEYVEACREAELKVGFYYSLMDWHHPDGASCTFDREAHKRFIDFTHGCVRELMENYGKIDILWYDVPLPLQTFEGWQSIALNQMVRKLQPDILINDRSYLPEDFSTPEESVVAAEAGRGWEACMTFNHTSWGHMPSAAQDSYTARQIVSMLNTACNGSGNLLLNIGPTPEGDVPAEAVVPLQTVGKWLTKNSEAVYGKLDIAPTRQSGCSRGPVNISATGSCSQKGNKVYLWCRCWPGKELTIGGFETKLKNVRFMASGTNVNFTQETSRIFLKDMPEKCPDDIVGITVIELEFFSTPVHRKYASTDVFQVWQF